MIRYAIIILSIFAFSCKRNIDLDKLEKVKLSYEDLPDKVKYALFNNKRSGADIKKKVINLDSNFYTVRKIEERDGPFAKPVYFIIKNKKLKIEYNTPDPFVFFNGTLFFPDEYNVQSLNRIKESNYFKIKLPLK